MTQETPFRIIFGVDAMILVKIEEPFPRTTFFQPTNNEEELRVNLDLLYEEHEVAHIWEYTKKAKASKRYNVMVFPKPLQRPYRIVEEVGQGAHMLEFRGRNIQRPRMAL
ncbi:hypothetical protein CR513_13466, partial [Mucuna pruriens]